MAARPLRSIRAGNLIDQPCETADKVKESKSGKGRNRPTSP